LLVWAVAEGVGLEDEKETSVVSTPLGEVVVGGVVTGGKPPCVASTILPVDVMVTGG
jgi:hypothetical protein